MAKSKDDKDVLFASVEMLSETKSQAESRVKLVRALVADEEIGVAELRRVQVLYADARSSVNAGLDRLLVDGAGHARLTPLGVSRA